MDIYAEATERKKQESFELLAAKLDCIFWERDPLESDNKNQRIQQFDNKFDLTAKNNTSSQLGGNQTNKRWQVMMKSNKELTRGFPTMKSLDK